MTAALQRSSVVLRAGAYGVVWLARRKTIVLHPIEAPSDPQTAHDVAMSFGELVAAHVAMPDAVIRCGCPVEVARDGQVVVGAIAGPLLCRYAVGVSRAFSDAQSTARWGAERRHREAASPQVKMVG